MAILLDSHLYEADIPDDLRHLIMYIARAGKYINHALQTGDLGLAGSSNLFTCCATALTCRTLIW